MGIETLLSRLDGLRPSKQHPHSWIAKCPAHADKSPSLTIRHVEDGRILLHCFSGCSAVDVVQAVGLAMTDLFPVPLTTTFLPKIRAPFSAMDALACLAQESFIVALAASDITLGKPLNDEFLTRVATAAGRIATALEVVHAR